jgi:hypothetical protein
MDKKKVDLTPYYTNDVVRKKIDVLLQKNAVVQSNLGIDSTKEERKNAKKETSRIKSDIKTMDKVFAEHCFPEND